MIYYVLEIPKDSSPPIIWIAEGNRDLLNKLDKKCYHWQKLSSYNTIEYLIMNPTKARRYIKKKRCYYWLVEEELKKHFKNKPRRSKKLALKQ